MNNTYTDTIKSLIEETNRAYEIYVAASHANSDYAEFAAQCHTDFSRALNNPALSQTEIRRLLRSGHLRHRNDAPESCWATFMSHYVRQGCNQNLKGA